jgi:hypothetical protein
MVRKNARLFLAIFVVAAAYTAAGAVAAADCFLYSADIGYVCNTQPAPAVYVAPDLPANSLLDDIQYAYIEDNANVYPEPSTAAPPVRNVGVGFLYLTISGEMEVDGQHWYIINAGEYVLAKDIRLVDYSAFRGTEVHAQPERPFGWVVLKVVPSDAPGDEPNPIFSELPRYTFLEVFDAETAEDGWIWYDIGAGRWIKQTHVSLVDLSPPPAAVGAGDYWVEVDLYEQTMAAYEGERMVFASLVSSGLNRWATQEGLYQVWDRWLETKMSGAEGKVDYYFIEDVPHTMYFDLPNQIALHGAYWHDRFGYKHSHGCVNMPPRAAEWVYNWSEHGPNALWVWVYTSDPAHYFTRYGAEPAGDG